MEHADHDWLVGREAELARLAGLAADLTAGRGGLAWLQGEPGVGKSALVDAVAAAARGAGRVVLRAAGEELMQPFPLQLMADCLGISARSGDTAAAEIAGLLRGDPEQAGSLDPVMTAAERMLELVDRRCGAGPVVLAAEDLQWADEPSLLLWARLARAADQIPLLLIGTARPLPQRPRVDQLRDLAADRGGAVIDLRPLDPAGVARLAGRLTAGTPGPRLTAALDRASGNPLYVRELTEALLRDGRVQVTGGVAELDGDVTATPASLQVAIGSRLGFLPAGARTTLRLAALLGNEFDAAELADATGQPMTRLAAVLTDAIAGGILADAGPRLRFRHELIHQILVEQTPPAIRPALHAETARKLAEAGRPVVSVARHLLAVPGGLDGWALDWLATVSEPSLYPMPQVSAGLLERALESDPDHSERWELLATRLARVLFWLGRDIRAAQVAASVVARTPDEILAARMRVQLMRSAVRRGQPQEALASVLDPPADDGLPLLWRSRLGSWSAQLRSAAGERRAGARLAAAALDQATASGDALTIAYARHACAITRDAAVREANVSAALTALTGADPESLDLRMLLSSIHVIQLADLGKLAEAEAALAEVLPMADRAGAFRAAAIAATAAGFCYKYGRWDEALVHLAGIEPEFLDTELLSPQHGRTALIALRRGDRATADAHLRAGVARLPQTAADPARPVSPLTQALAAAAEADGDRPRAVALMAAWLTAVPGLRPGDRHDDDLPCLVRLALAAGDTGTARAAAAASAADVAVDGSPSRIAAAAFCRALLDGDADGLLSVAADYRAYGWLPDAAAALEDAADHLARSGAEARARSALTDATAIYAGLGATWDIRRADARLRAHGIRRGPRAAHRRAATGWAALTPSEARIAGMVARGLSNPDIASELFLSRRTVQTHVSNILSKLEVRSRTDIMRTAPRAPELCRD
jgi:DNA-binding CsgD family transcriptional regulator